MLGAKLFGMVMTLSHRILKIASGVMFLSHSNLNVMGNPSVLSS